jgi:hypothetical protein
MKFSLLTAALILAIASFFGWQDHRKLAAVRESHGRLFEEARALGLSTDGLVQDGVAVLPSKSGRTEGDSGSGVDPKEFAARLAAFALKMEAMEKSGTPPDEGFQQEIFALLDEMLQLDPAALKILIGELRANGELTGEMRRNIVGFAISMMANDHPASALAIFTESSDLFGDEDGRGRHVLGQALSKWASQDPAAALDWVRENAAAHPELVTEETKHDLVGGAAKQDPRLAFKLIGELGLDDAGSAGRKIAESATTPAERSAILSALRDHLATETGEEADEVRRSTLAALAANAMKDGFESATAWIDGAGLGEADAATMANGIEHWRTGPDTGRWIEWMGGKLPAGTLDTKVIGMMDQWTRSDYKAAGQWLNEAAEGPAKVAAVRSYAHAVAPYDPAAAEQWAKTLSPGEQREELLEMIGKVRRAEEETIRQPAE